MSNTIGLNFEDTSTHLQDVTLEQFNLLRNIWISCYGKNSDEAQESIISLKKSQQDFWTDQIEMAEVYKGTLMKDIEHMGKEAVELERILKLPQQVKELDNDIPLLRLKKTLEDLVSKYRDLGTQRVHEYEKVRKQEEDLCTLLDEPIKIQPLPVVDLTSCHKSSRTVNRSQSIPSDERLEECRARVEELRKLEIDMQNEFYIMKEELKNLLQECEVEPIGKYERFAVEIEEEGLPSVTFSGPSLRKLKECVNSFNYKKQVLIDEADHLRNEVSKVSKKLLKEPMFLDSLFTEYSGFGQKTTQKLRQVLDELISERKYKLKELILLHRDMLEDLWSKCHYSDEERSRFRAYYADHFSEDILSLHELEVERMELFYEQHKRIFALADKHKELWDRLLHLEQEASSSQRLFTNRGGRLLLEEKERKTIQKKLPAVKAELVTLLNEFKAKNGTDFLDFGIPLIDSLERMEEEREMAKENEKRQRKAANSETLRLESRLGTQPVANKRKLLAPKCNGTKVMKMSAHSTVNHSTTSSTKSTSSYRGQKLQQPPVHSTMLTPGRVGIGAAAGSYVMRHTPQLLNVPSATQCHTPASSTPKNGSPSYESFQEMLLDPMSTRIHQNSTKREERVLRPRNHDSAQAKTPFKTPSRTPSKIPAKTPFRIATGSKIPSVVPPISPRRGAKLTTPRSRLPIIF